MAGVSVSPAIVGGSLSLYKYEPFGPYTFSAASGYTLDFSTTSAELQSFCTLSDDATSLVFAGTLNISYTATLRLIITTLGSQPNVTSTTTITVGVGRFFPPSAGQVYQLYQYENISNTLGSNPDIETALAIDSIVSSPSLPSGLSIAAADYTGNAFVLQGTPRLQQAQSNYRFIGSSSSTGGVVTATIAAKVNPPRVVITPSLQSVTRMVTGTPIVPVSVTAIQPNDNGPVDNFRYGWGSLPTGFSFVDVSSNPVTQGAYLDPTSPITLIGTPTVATANAFAVSGNPYTIEISGYHTTPSRTIIVGKAYIQLSFDETVLLSSSVSSSLYEQKPLTPPDVVISAASYFPSGSMIASLTYDSLPPGLSMSALVGGTAYLTGTPTASIGNYTFTATSANGYSRSLVVPITVNADAVVFGGVTPPSGTPFVFVVSRPLVLDYPSSIRFSATSASGSTITYSTSINFATYGLVFNPSAGTLTGTPTSSLATTSVTITATDALGTIGTTTISLTISKDVFTWETQDVDEYFIFFQNRPITPYQVVVTNTLSGRPIQSYSALGGMPTGLVLSPSGKITGTYTGAADAFDHTFTIVATTGYEAPLTTSSNDYKYRTKGDSLVIIQSNGIDPIADTFSVQYDTLQYSTAAVVNPTYTISNLYPLQYPTQPALTINGTGILSGDFTGVIPYPNYVFDLTATYAGISNTAPVVMTISNAPVPLNVALASVAGKMSISTTATYPFQATLSGDRSQVGQSWSPFYGSNISSIYLPDVSRLGSSFVLVSNGNKLVDGTYNALTSNIDWSSDVTPLPTYSAPVAIANDGMSNWVAVSLSARVQSLTRTGNSGAWTLNTNTRPTEPTMAESGLYTLQYCSPNYVFGQYGGAGSCNVLYSATGVSWSIPDTLPAFSNINRFAVSNTTIVAIGSYTGGSPTDAPISVSTDGGSNWVTQSVDLSNLRGPIVTLNDIAYGNGKWVTCGTGSDNSNVVAYSSNLSNWTLFTPVANHVWSAVSFNTNGWTIAGTYSPDGANVITSPQSRILSIDANWTTGFVTSNTVFSSTSNSGQFVKLLSASFPATPDPVVGTITIPPVDVPVFTLPTETTSNVYQYVPYSIKFQAGVADPDEFIFYYASDVPIGFTFTPDPTGKYATLEGIPPSNGASSTITVRAKTQTGNPATTQFGLRTILPFFVHPQAGASGYTALLRKEVEMNAAQNARDNKTYPQVDPLAGPFTAPRAPDVVTLSNCFLGLCKKPCPTCHTMM